MKTGKAARGRGLGRPALPGIFGVARAENSVLPQRSGAYLGVGRKRHFWPCKRLCSRSPKTPVEMFQVGLYGVVEADLELFCNSWSVDFWEYGCRPTFAWEISMYGVIRAGLKP